MARRRNGELVERWRERLSRYRTSGLTVAEFCQDEGVSTAAFYSWKRRLGVGRSSAAGNRRSSAAGTKARSGRMEEPVPPAFVPVNVTGSLESIEIELPNRARVRLPSGIEIERLSEAIRAAGGMSAREEGSC